jgi:hypothetical protein
MSALPNDSGPTADVLRAAREAVDDATRRLDELTAQLADRATQVDLVESVLDAVLDVTDGPVIVVDRGRRVTALSRAAATEHGCDVGAALSEIVPAEVASRIGALLDEADADGADDLAERELPDLGAGARVRILSSGHAILALPREGGGG